jgi:hypothetical protein
VILKSFRLRAKYGPQRIKNHVARGTENHEIIYVQGEERDLDDMWADALARGREYAARHVIIAPEKAASLEQMLELMQQFCDEFGIDMRRGFIRAHKKPRIIESAHDHHLHGIFAEWDESTGRVIDSKMSYRRQSLLARVWEFENAHPPLHDDHHHQWVVSELVRQDRTQIAEWLSAAYPYDAPRTRTSMAEATMQMLKTRGLHGNEMRAAVREHWHAAPRVRAQLPGPARPVRDGDQARHRHSAGVGGDHLRQPVPLHPCGSNSWCFPRHNQHYSWRPSL